MNKITQILDCIIPKREARSAFMAVFINSILSVLGVYLGISVFAHYSMSLFLLGPFILGIMSSMIHTYHGNRTLNSCIAVALLSVASLALILLIFAMEGFICIIMALPLGISVAIVGAWVGYFIHRKFSAKNDAPKIMIFLIVLMPLCMGFEYIKHPEPTLFSVQSYVEIDAPVETVWKNVVEFPTLPEPTEMIFRAGIAYPMNAEIKGKGVGAIRYCNFSTGSFVEPITAWDENHLLKFDVVDQPIPMKELSPYKIDTPHLNGYMTSKRGQFLLTQMSDGKIRLEGTTWYSNQIWPEAYWKIWSDHIIHVIHKRVLNHIKEVSEEEKKG